MRPKPIAAALTLLVLLALAPLALAHATLVRSEPPANAVLSAAPTEIHLWMSEPMVQGISSIRVLDSGGAEVQQPGGAGVTGANGTELVVALPPLPDGVYLVTWLAFSAVDGHTTEGTFGFSVGVTGQTAASGTAAASQGAASAVVWRWLLLLAQAAVGGAIVFHWAVWRPAVRAAQADSPADGGESASGVWFLYAALGLAAVAATGLFLDQLLTASGATLAEVLTGGLALGTVLASRLGTAWIGRLASLAGLAIIASDILRAGGPTRAPGNTWGGIVRYGSLWLAALLLYFTTASSHSAALGPGAWLTLPMAADWLHLAATAAWAGGLLQFLAVLPGALRGRGPSTPLLREIVVRYSTLAAFGVGLMLASGIYLSTVHVGGWERLSGSEYGRALLLKIAVVIPMLLFGAVNLLWVKPGLEAEARAAETGQPKPALLRAPFSAWFWRIVTLEAVAGIAVLAAAGRLTELPRGADAGSLGPGQLRLTGRADDVGLTLTLEPAQQGPNEFEVTLNPPDEASVSLRFVALDRALGATEVLLDETGPGVFSASNATLNLPGSWQIEAAVRRPGAYDTFARFQVYVQPDGRISTGGGASGLVNLLLPFAGLFAGLALIVGGTGWLVIARQAASGRLAYYGLLLPAFVAAAAGGYVLLRFFSDTTPGSLLTNPAQPDAISVVTGQTIYREKCVECHGTEGRGDGPQSAGLSPRPPQPFGVGRAARAADGDLYWWTRNGVTGSAMPAFRTVLSEDQTWNVVNYLKTLGAGAQAENPGATAVALPPTPTPPGGALPEPGQSEDQAINLLDQVELAMEQLAYLREQQTIVDDLGASLTFTYQYAAPDRLSYASAGQEVVVIGSTQYFRFGDGDWQSSQGARPYTFPPTHGYTQNAVGARYEGASTLAGRPVEVVSFADSSLPAAYRLWVDAESKRILQLAMEAPNHHMISTYDNFDVPVEIEAPTQ